MKRINVAVSYQAVVRYAPDVPDSELEALIDAMDKKQVPQKILAAMYDVIRGFPGVVVEIYEDENNAPITSVATAPIRRTGT